MFKFISVKYIFSYILIKENCSKNAEFCILLILSQTHILNIIICQNLNVKFNKKRNSNKMVEIIDTIDFIRG